MTLAPAPHRAYSYRVTIQPAELPVPLPIFKEFLKIDSDDSSQDELLTLFLGTATTYAEKLTKRDFIQRTYETFRDFFPRAGQNEGFYPFGIVPSGARGLFFVDDNVGYEIRRSPLVSVSSITYTDTSNAPQTVASTVFYNTIEEDYSEVVTLPDQEWPDDSLRKMQNIVITFICGLSATSTLFQAEHPNLFNAIMMHAVDMYENRGDCATSACTACSRAAPAAAQGIYLQCQIINI